MRLRSSLDPADFDRLYRSRPEAWRAAAIAQCARCGVPGEPLVAFPGGSNLVAAVGERWVLKLFPPFHRHQWESERRVLPALRGWLPLAVPTLESAGERDDGWTFALMTRLPGVTLDESWPQLSRSARVSLLEVIGQTMARVHARPLGSLRALPPPWETFLAHQRAGCRERHARLGAPAWLQRDLDGFLREAWPRLGAPFAPALLTGEYTPFNLLGELAPGGYQLTGMIDLGDAMVGPGDYDLLGPSTFLAAGDPELVHALLRGHDPGTPRLTPERRRRLMALLLLHRYSDLDAQVCIAGWRERADSLAALAELIWPPEAVGG